MALGIWKMYTGALALVGAKETGNVLKV